MKSRAEQRARELIAGALLVLLFLLFLGWLVRGGYLWFVPQRLSVVRFEGQLVYSGKELLRQSGLELDRPLTPRRMAEARRRLEELPLVRRVGFGWRRGELRVVVGELLPVALVKVAGAYYLLLEDGSIAPRQAVEGREQVLDRLRTVPVLVLSNPQQREDPELIATARRALAAAVAFGRPVVRYLRVLQGGELRLEMKDGAQIELGANPTGMELRVVRGLEVWRTLHSRSRGSPLLIDLATSEGVAYVKLGSS